LHHVFGEIIFILFVSIAREIAVPIQEFFFLSSLHEVLKYICCSVEWFPNGCKTLYCDPWIIPYAD